jgi:HEAT repeat protein
MFADDNADLQNKISNLIDELHDPDGIKRQKARHDLILIGRNATPALVEIVSNETGHARWEAIKTLEGLRDPDAAPALVEALMDEEKGTRWAASNALIGLDRAGIRPLLVGLTRHYDSVQFREVAHHILHTLKDRNSLLPKELEVFEALESIEPAVKVPWAAEAALEELDSNG